MGAVNTPPLIVDMSALEAQLQRADKKTAQADSAVRAGEIRMDSLIKRIEQARREEEDLERANERAAHHALKHLVKSEITGAVSSLVDEIGIPEAAQPIMKIGTAAVRGAQIAGVYGAVAFATIEMVNELREMMRAEAEKREALRARVLQMADEQASRNIDIEADNLERQRQFDEVLRNAREEARKEFADFFDTARLNYARQAW